MKMLSRLKKRSVTGKTNSQHKEKTLKDIQRDIERLRDNYKKMELRPCRGDADLRQREDELRALKSRIYALEQERDKFLYTRASEG